MSYLALARKWRPRRFDDVVGQPHVVQALKHALDGDRLHPAILLTGTRGVGKTTLARIVAKGLNCEPGVTATPCGECGACREVDEGRFVDLLEIDAASRTKVEDTRAMLDNVQYSPVHGRYKVYLIDEVHMLSGHSFNALLKTLEEPPPHVKFILATTDPQKLPVTVLSRCLQFHLRRLPVAVIRELLAQVLASEQAPAQPAALAELARAADGSMRDGLSLLDQALVFAGGGELTAAMVEDMLGTAGRRTLLALLAAVSAGDAARVQELLVALDAQAPDFEALLTDMAAYLHRAALQQQLSGLADEDDPPELAALAAQVAPEDLQLYYQIAVSGRRDLAWAPDPRSGFEMTVLRMLAFRPAGDAPAGGGARRPREITQPQPAPERSAATTAASGADLSWAERVDTLGLDGFARQLARNCVWLGQEGDTVRVGLPATVQHLLQEDRRTELERALTQALGEPLRVQVEIAESDAAPTPAQLDRQRQAQRLADAQVQIEEDPDIKLLKARFGATLRPGSVQPLENGS